MALFDKLNQVAKNIGDKTNDAIEATKLSSKANSENAAGGEELKKIGRFYYDRYVSGVEVEPEIAGFCQAAQGHFEAAGAAQSEASRIRNENAGTPVFGGAAAGGPAPAARSAAGGAVCASCGTANLAGTKFCSGCGARLEEQQAAGNVCPSCGAAVAPGVKFCAECGSRVE